MQFIVQYRDRLPAGAIELAYLANHEESPYQTHVHWVGDWLVVDRDEAESGTFTIPWVAGDSSPLALTTGTLIERPRPYLLEVELARGTICCLRTYAFLWSAIGLAVPSELDQLLEQAVQELALGATSQDRPAEASLQAQSALDIALRATAVLCTAYGAQSAVARKNTSPRAPILVGATLGDRAPDQPLSEFLLDACNTLAVPLAWREIEGIQGARSWQLSDAQLAWCQAHERHIVAGPLLRLDKGALPEFVAEETNFDALLSALSNHLRAVVERYRGRIQVWNCGANINNGQALPLTEEQRLRLAVRAIETVRAADPHAPIILTLDQPWGEYLRDLGRPGAGQGPGAGQDPVARCPLSPIHFADALLRGELGLSGFGLRINLGLSRGATLPRDVLEVSRQIDRWSMFNIPLLIELTLPAAAAQTDTPEQGWIERFIPVFLGKPAVQGLFWGRCFDGDSGSFADRGLFDAEGQPKPALRAFSSIRRLLE